MIFTSRVPDQHIPEGISLPNFLLEAFKTKPQDRPAIICGHSGQTWTFKQLSEAIQTLATHFHELGMKKGEVVALYSSNNAIYPIAFHAANLIGITLTTVNPLYTTKELSNQISDSGAVWLVAQADVLDRAKEAAALSGNRIKRFFTFTEQLDGITSLASLLDAKPKGNLPKVQLDSKTHPSCICYSSGTTGLPKGVVLTHYNIISNVIQVSSLDTFFTKETPYAITIGVLPFFHVYGITIIMNVNLYQGVTVITMSKFDLKLYLELIQKYKVTRLAAVPPIILALAKHPMVAQYDTSSLKHVISGAAPLGSDLEKELCGRLKVTCGQGYGMSELSPTTHASPPNPIGGRPGSCGLLLANQQAKLLDENGKMVGVGEEGELYIKGPNVMKEYLNNPKATKETIMPDGFLRTGDMAKVDKDGFFYITDRIKELIKYKGMQVAPAELEGILLSHPNIADTAVIAVPDVEAGDLPKAFVVLKPGATVTEKDIQEFIKSKVAPHKQLRGGVQFIPEIPKSAAGKILRRILVEAERAKKAKL
eukprot:TRINITY_DN6506_c0_g4_i1.p1 TRINITY_DN6506_c0_g4~~TRINITY_DN6506_c0_g4_i1.p1  ORF type:complete len:537 (-),score=207.78 TRINITY_DN6506_c0_g4_i1:21-1631(-)